MGRTSRLARSATTWRMRAMTQRCFLRWDAKNARSVADGIIALMTSVSSVPRSSPFSSQAKIDKCRAANKPNSLSLGYA